MVLKIRSSVFADKKVTRQGARNRQKPAEAGRVLFNRNVDKITNHRLNVNCILLSDDWRIVIPDSFGALPVTSNGKRLNKEPTTFQVVIADARFA
jgi:hypothetical protein